MKPLRSPIALVASHLMRLWVEYGPLLVRFRLGCGSHLVRHGPGDDVDAVRMDVGQDRLAASESMRAWRCASEFGDVGFGG